MPQISIALSRLMLCFDVGRLIKPAGAKQNGWKRGHPFDFEADLKAWPRWRRRFYFVRLNRDLAGAAPAWRLWIYSRKGGRSLDLFWRPARFWFRAHLHLPRTL